MRTTLLFLFFFVAAVQAADSSTCPTTSTNLLVSTGTICTPTISGNNSVNTIVTHTISNNNVTYTISGTNVTYTVSSNNTYTISGNNVTYSISGNNVTHTVNTTSTVASGNSVTHTRLDGCDTKGVVTDAFYSTLALCSNGEAPIYTRSSASDKCDANGQMRKCPATPTRDQGKLPDESITVVRYTYGSTDLTCTDFSGALVETRLTKGACEYLPAGLSEGGIRSRTHAYLSSGISVASYKTVDCSGTAESVVTYESNTCLVGGVVLRGMGSAPEDGTKVNAATSVSSSFVVLLFGAIASLLY